MWGGDRTDSVPCTSASEDGIEVTYSAWGFAKQTVYYNTSGG